MKTISNEIKAYFVKDFDIPIQVVKEPYFEYYLDLFQKHFKARDKFQLLLSALEAFEDEESFHKAVHKFIDEIVLYISSKQEYVEFGKIDMNQFKAKIQPIKGNIYIEPNVDKKFISIDLKSANFQALRYANPMLVDVRDSYDDFVRKFSSIPYMTQSKRLRQVILGNLNPSRQQAIQKFLISLIMLKLIEKGIPLDRIRATSSDEIVIEDIGDINSEDFLAQIFSITFEFQKGMGINSTIKHFKLLNLGTKKFSFFAKEDVWTKDIEIKGVNSAYMPEVVKYLKKEAVVEADRLFYQDGRLCSFKDSLFD